MEEKKFTFNEVIDIYSGIEKITGYTEADCFDFNYAIARNHDKAKSVFNSLSRMTNEINKPCAEFDAKKTEAMRKYSNGKHIVLPNGAVNWQVQKEHEDTCAKEIQKLAETYKEQIEERKTKHEAYILKLDQECTDFVPYLIDKDKLPKNLASEHFRIIFSLIKE